MIPGLVTAAAKILLDYETGSSVVEVADTASDQCEYTCYLTPDEDAEFYAALTREVLSRFGFDGGASDASDIPIDALRREAT